MEQQQSMERHNFCTSLGARVEIVANSPKIMVWSFLSFPEQPLGLEGSKEVAGPWGRMVAAKGN